jgi:hypothetical protein
MSIKRTFNGASIIKPGAYSKLVVENLTGFPLQATGVVGIIGEAVGGAPHVLDILSKENIQSAKARYKSGPIADALELLANPSKDPRIVNGASTIVVYKTNAGTQAAYALKANDGTTTMLNLTSKNYGLDENQISALISAGTVADADAVLQGTIAGPFTVANTDTLKLTINGTLYTYTCSLTGSQTAAALIADINNAAHWAPSKPVIAALVGATQKIQVTLDSATLTTAVHDYGSMKVDVSCTLDTLLGITGSARGVKGSRILTFAKGTLSEVSPELAGAPVMSIIYTGAGTAATISIQKSGSQLVLTSTCTGALGDNLSLVLQDANGLNKFTVQSLVDVINGTGKYTAVVLANAQMNANRLDFYSGLEIKNVAGNIAADMAQIVDYLTNVSSLVSGAAVDNISGDLKTFATAVFLSGGTDGTSVNADFSAGFDGFKQQRINCVVPLISKDIGSLTIDSINALASAHALWAWSTTGRSERGVFCSYQGSKANFKAKAGALNSGYTMLVGQDVKVLDKTGSLVWMDPWAYACVLAGMRAGAEVGEPLTFKALNVNDMRVNDGSWDPKKDFAEMIDAGCTIAEPMDGGGFRTIVGNTTYAIDPSFVWNRESVVAAAGFLAYDLRFNLELTFTGNKARTGTAEAIANFIKARMSTYLDAEIIVGDDLNKGLGYTKLSVSLQGNTALITISVTPVQGIDFLLPTIYLADIRQSA